MGSPEGSTSGEQEDSGPFGREVTEADLDPSEIEVISDGKRMKVTRYARPLIRVLRVPEGEQKKDTLDPIDNAKGSRGGNLVNPSSGKLDIPAEPQETVQ